jgi:hypothetical protein
LVADRSAFVERPCVTAAVDVLGAPTGRGGLIAITDRGVDRRIAVRRLRDHVVGRRRSLHAVPLLGAMAVGAIAGIALFFYRQ